MNCIATVKYSLLVLCTRNLIPIEIIEIITNYIYESKIPTFPIKEYNINRFFQYSAPNSYENRLLSAAANIVQKDFKYALGLDFHQKRLRILLRFLINILIDPKNILVTFCKDIEFIIFPKFREEVQNILEDYLFSHRGLLGIHKPVYWDLEDSIRVLESIERFPIELQIATEIYQVARSLDFIPA